MMKVTYKSQLWFSAIVIASIVLAVALSDYAIDNPDKEYKYIIIFTNIGVEGMPDSLFYHIECEPPCRYPEDVEAIQNTKDRFYESRGLKE